jgi:hypothetical protein
MAVDPIAEELKRIDQKLTLERQRRGSVGGRASLLNARVAAFVTFWPLFVAAFTFLLIVGPGLAAVFTILKAMNIWLWLLLIVGLIFVWRD